MKKKFLVIAMALALVAVLVAPLAAFAANTTTITGDVASGYSFTPPAAISLGTMTPGTTVTGTSTGTLDGNDTSGYTVTAIDAKTTNTGFMVSGTNVLQNKFQIGATAGSVANADVAQTLLDVASPGTNSVPLYVSQQISYTDVLANGYTITITYTVLAK